jgi:hypothetical protein
MPSSAPKDHFHFMVMHKIPPHLSKTEFETKLEALIDEALQLPSIQKNLLKIEMVRIRIPSHQHTTQILYLSHRDIDLSGGRVG